MTRFIVLALLIGCGPAPAKETRPVVVPTASAPVPVATPPVAVVPPMSDAKCPPPPVGHVTDDETPELSGTSTPAVEVLEWLDARGVTKNAAVSWYVAHYAGGLDMARGEASFSQAWCHALAVGDNAEEALLCAHNLPFTLLQGHAVILVVRKKKIVPVLDVGLGIRAMDFPEAHVLDLALAVAADGKSATLADRARDGAILIEAPSVCREREKLLDACEDALAKGTNPDPMCPIIRSPSSKPRVARNTAPTMGYPATLHDCIGVRTVLHEMDENGKGLPDTMRNEARLARGFAETSCKQRGHYVWRTDRFVRE